MTFNILFAGVGGLGAMLTSVIVARAANFDGYQVNGSQIHGLAQRGGAIPIQVRFGKEEIFSPMIRNNQADLIIGFELVEALRYTNLVDRERTNFLIDTLAIKPVETENYPNIDEVKTEVNKIAKKVLFIDAAKISKEKFGDLIYGNIILLGVAIKEGILPLSKEAITKALEVTLPNALDNNLAALELGLTGTSKST